ncbi:MAG: ankyrin repeat domain-containing protein [Amoebophilaceae bacterium]|nr:ankyrin repeat domain-containing protein [Amoebophilaceae bacterium]
MPAIELSFNLEPVAISLPSGSSSTNSRKRLYPYLGAELSPIKSLAAPTLSKRPNLSRQCPLLSRLLDGDNRFSVGYIPILGRNSAFVYCSCFACSNGLHAGFIQPLKDSINAINTNDCAKFMELMQANYPLALAISTIADIDGSTCLMLASKQGNVSIVRWLSRNGSDVTSRNSANKTALDYAIHNKNTAVIDFLIPRSL